MGHAAKRARRRRLDAVRLRADDRPEVEVWIRRDPNLERWVGLVEALLAVKLEKHPKRETAEPP